MLRMVRVYCLMVFILGSWCTAVHGQDLRCHILAAKDMPLGDATVYLLREGKLLGEQVTDSAGFVAFKGVDTGKCKMVVWQPQRSDTVNAYVYEAVSEEEIWKGTPYFEYLEYTVGGSTGWYWGQISCILKWPEYYPIDPPGTRIFYRDEIYGVR